MNEPSVPFVRATTLLRVRLVIAAGLLAGGVNSALGQNDESAKLATATATLQVSATPPRVLFREQPGAGAEKSDFATYQRTLIQLIKNDVVILKALEQPGIRDLGVIKAQADPIAWLSKELVVAFPDHSEVMTISLATSKPEESSKLVNAVVDGFFEVVVDKEQQQRRVRFQQLDDYLRRSEKQLEINRKTLRDRLDVLRSEGITTAPALRRLNEQRLADCSRELRRIRLEKAAVEVKMERRRNKVTNPDIAKEYAELSELLAIASKQEETLKTEERTLLEGMELENEVLASARQEIASGEKMAEEIRRELEVLKVELSAPGRIQIISKARVPKAK